MVQGDCCSDNDCKPNMKCENYICIRLPIQEPANLTQPTNETTNQTTNISAP